MCRVAVVSLSILLTLPLVAATPVTLVVNGVPTALEWSETAFPLRYQIDARLAQANPNAQAMVDRAFLAWQSVPGADVTFRSEGIQPAAGRRVPDRIVVSLADDLFTDSGAAAVTTYTYDHDSARMIDAQVRVDPSVFNGALNGQMALQHEIGHVLGLDHSAVLTSIMYPYIGSGNTPAAFDADDRIAIAGMYPKGDPMLQGATISGRVTGDQGGIFAAQVVAVNRQGEPVATVLSNGSGEFSLAGLPAGSYRLYAEPLDGPVDTGALQGTFWRQARQFSFPTHFMAGEIEVESGRVYGNVVLNSVGSVELNPKWIGVSAPEASDVSLSTSPATVRPGQTVTITLAGDGFTSGMTEFEILNPAFRRVSDYSWSSNYVRATYAVDASAPASSAVVVVQSGRETATLTGALRVHRPTRSRAVGK